jgi:hypothetical protein
MNTREEVANIGAKNMAEEIERLKQELAAEKAKNYEIHLESSDTDNANRLWQYEYEQLKRELAEAKADITNLSAGDKTTLSAGINVLIEEAHNAAIEECAKVADNTALIERQKAVYGEGQFIAGRLAAAIRTLVKEPT